MSHFSELRACIDRNIIGKVNNIKALYKFTGATALSPAEIFNIKLSRGFNIECAETDERKKTSRFPHNSSVVITI